MLNLFIQSFVNNFTDIALTFSDSSFNSSLFELIFLHNFFKVYYQNLFFFTKLTILFLLVKFSCVSLKAKFCAVKLLHFRVLIYLP